MHGNILARVIFTAAAILGLAPALAQSTDVESARVNPEIISRTEDAVPVRLSGRVLFEISAPIGALGVEARAAAIERRLMSVADGPGPDAIEWRVVEREGLSEIMAGDTLIRTVTDRDASGTGRTRRQVAADQVLIMREAIAMEIRDRSALSLLRGAIYALIATLVLVVALVVLRRLTRRIRQHLSRLAGEWRWKERLTRLSLMTPAALVKLSGVMAAAATWLLAIILVYAYLEFTLSLFPWTRGIAEMMMVSTRAAVVSVGSGLVDYLPSLLNILVIVVVTRLLLHVVRAIFEQIRTGRIALDGFYAEWAMPTYALVRFFLIAVAAVMIFPYLPGSGSEGFKGVTVFLGLLVSLGAASAIANLIAGIVITYMRPFRAGDRVKIADAVGDIIGKDLFVVRLRTIKNVDITIPNSLVLANHIINFSSSAESQGLVLNTTVSIGYDVDWRKVHQLLLTAAQKTEGVLSEPAPFILQTSLGDFYVTYELNAYTKAPARMATIYSDLHAEIQNAFAEAGVEIMSPHYTSIRDGNAAALPEAHLPRDYQRPGFNIFSRILRPER